MLPVPRPDASDLRSATFPMARGRRSWFRHCLLSALILASLAVRARAAEDAVLLAATASGYTPGMIIAADQRLTLPEATSITLLFRSGQQLQLHGPLDSSLERAMPSSGDNSVATLAAALRRLGARVEVVGGARGAGTTQARAALEDVRLDPRRSGTYCLRPGGTVWIVRPVAEPAAYALRRLTPGGNKTFQVNVFSGAAGLEWPGSLAIEDGDRFELLADGQVQATFSFQVITAAPIFDAGWVAEGVLRGCRAQVEEALRRLIQAATPAR